MKLWNKLSHSKPVQDYATVFQRQIEVDCLQRGIPSNLEGFRAKFRRNLVGHWKTEPESELLPVTEWKFFSNGTAVQLNSSIIIGSSEVNFCWRERGDLVIDMCKAGDEDENSNWFPIHYNFKQKNGLITLVQLPETPTFKFYLTTDYLFFQGGPA
ncbi:hypothetical protein IAD21_03647 [Abditibacteriota bacterium]|nr:hypothetical protein IAD21_03647 [Abditibacteriota bacterium]